MSELALAIAAAIALVAMVAIAYHLGKSTTYVDAWEDGYNQGFADGQFGNRKWRDRPQA